MFLKFWSPTYNLFFTKEQKKLVNWILESKIIFVNEVHVNLFTLMEGEFKFCSSNKRYKYLKVDNHVEYNKPK